MSHELFRPSDLESTLSPLESLHKSEPLLRKIWDADHWWCEQAVVTGEITELLHRELDTRQFNSSCILFVCVCANEVSALSLSPLQKQNIPSDYEIPVNYIPKEVVRMTGLKAELTRNSQIHERLNISQRLLTDFCFSRLARAGWC